MNQRSCEPRAHLCQRLYALIHVNGAPRTWQLLDVTPGGSPTATVSTFCLESFGGRLCVAAAVRSTDGLCSLFTSCFTNPNFTWDTTKNVISPKPAGKLKERLPPCQIGPLITERARSLFMEKYCGQSWSKGHIDSDVFTSNGAND
jgi:hypothetical protein